uniref:Vacuolar-sorting protein SNF8 n=1 Tax=Caenorhabditis japonica TaxID=281687 RepID=A0A8R1EG15_CAEJA
KVLGNGFELVPLGGGRFLVQSVPGELSMDHSRVLQLAEDAAYVTKELIMDKLRWVNLYFEKVIYDFINY